MLLKSEVIKKIRVSEISIRYPFDLREQGKVIRLDSAVEVDPDDQESIATQLFEKNYFGDRLSVTLGPIVLSLNYRKLRVDSTTKKGHTYSILGNQKTASKYNQGNV